MQILNLSVLVVVALLGAAFAMENPHTVDFGYFLGRSAVALSLLLSLALGLGVLLGLAAGLLPNWRLRRECRRLRAHLARAEPPGDQGKGAAAPRGAG